MRWVNSDREGNKNKNIITEYRRYKAFNYDKNKH
jgi:hypothetical protein